MTEEELIRETRRLIGRWDNIRIVGQGWAGDTRRGFEFNPIRTTSGGGTTPVTPNGACCPEDGDCFISTQAVCEGGGGTYQGDGTTCEPDPCPQTGACCVGIDCTIETEDDCTGMGGTYQGDGTDCDPNPCETTCEGCFYTGYLGGNNYKFQTITVSETVIDTLGNCGGRSGSNSFFRTTFLDPDNSCFEACLTAGGTSNCEGSEEFGNCCGDTGPDCSQSYDCDGWPGFPDCVFPGSTCFGLLDSAGLGWCASLSGFVTINDSTQVLSGNCDPLCPDSTLIVTVTLSGICSDS